jgi:hypothetical protein
VGGWLSGVKKVDWKWCWSLWWTKEQEGVVMAIRGEGVGVRWCPSSLGVKEQGVGWLWSWGAVSESMG